MDPSDPGEDCSAESAPVLRQLIAECHTLLLFDNAAFLSERLFALDRGIESAYWVAQSHFLLGDFSHVFHFLKALHPFHFTFQPSKDFGAWHWKLLHLWGVACLRLQKHQNAEQIFSQQAALPDYTPTTAELAAHHYFSGVVARRLRNAKGAIQHFVEGYTRNPFLFSAFEEACACGQAPKMDSAAIFSPQAGLQYIEEHLTPTAATEELPEADDNMLIEGADQTTLSRSRPAASSSQPLAKKATPAPRKAPRSAGSAGLGTGLCRPQPVYPGAGPLSKRPKPLAARTGPQSGVDEVISTVGVQSLMQLLEAMGEAHRLLCLYKCPQCIQMVQRIPSTQRTTGWVLSLLGKAYVELAEYSEACGVFTLQRQREPWRLEGLVEHSTALYQLKRDKELSALAQGMAEQDRFSPHSLTVLANCFSLAGNHDQAITFLKRASKQAPHVAYTHTLLGHEHFSIDDIEEALQQYRHAMLINPLHFNAWYGMGQVYMKQEQFAQAQHYFSVAIKINGNSSPLHVHLAMTLQHQEKYREALENLQAAITIQPNNLLARLKRAQLYLSLSKPADALQELEFLREKAPKEAQICLTLGKCYQRLGQKAAALQCFHLALDLEPKENVAIKRLMDQCLQAPDDAA